MGLQWQLPHRKLLSPLVVHAPQPGTCPGPAKWASGPSEAAASSARLSPGASASTPGARRSASSAPQPSVAAEPEPSAASARPETAAAAAAPAPSAVGPAGAAAVAAEVRVGWRVPGGELLPGGLDELERAVGGGAGVLVGVHEEAEPAVLPLDVVAGDARPSTARRPQAQHGVPAIGPPPRGRGGGVDVVGRRDPRSRRGAPARAWPRTASTAWRRGRCPPGSTSRRAPAPSRPAPPCCRRRRPPWLLPPRAPGRCWGAPYGRGR
jgi:hypothetical protein